MKSLSKNKLVSTDDGSHTLYNVLMDEHYHSTHGAIQESMHVFIKAGLEEFLQNNPTNQIKILEVGFGTGLNAFLTLIKSLGTKNVNYSYTSLEPYPIENELINVFNFPNSQKEINLFQKLHYSSWGRSNIILNNFELLKIKIKLKDLVTSDRYDIIYYDAFGPNSQEEMWKIENFKKLYKLSTRNGILVTYCAKGQVRRDLQEVGYKIERLKGPIGKREMLRATKN